MRWATVVIASDDFLFVAQATKNSTTVPRYCPVSAFGFRDVHQTAAPAAATMIPRGTSTHPTKKMTVRFLSATAPGQNSVSLQCTSILVEKAPERNKRGWLVLHLPPSQRGRSFFSWFNWLPQVHRKENRQRCADTAFRTAGR